MSTKQISSIMEKGIFYTCDHIKEGSNINSTDVVFPYGITINGRLMMCNLCAKALAYDLITQYNKDSTPYTGHYTTIPPYK